MASAKIGDMIIRGVRFSYAYIFEPFKGDNGSSYTSHGILELNDPQVAQIVATMKAVAKEMWKDEADAVYQQLKGKDKLCLHMGDVTKAGEEAYKGKIYISANSKNPVRVVETRGGVNVELTAADARPRSGDYGNLIVNIWAQNNKFGKRINAQLMGVQYVRKGTPLGGGGRVATLDEFGVEPSDADSEAPVASNIAKPADVADLMG